jgi:hypothetical protein
LAQALGEVHAELADVTELLDRTRHAGAPLDDADRLRAHRDALTQRIRRLELDAKELQDIFASEPEPEHAGANERGDLRVA